MSTMIDERDEAKRRVRLGALMIHAPATTEALARVRALDWSALLGRPVLVEETTHDLGPLIEFGLWGNK